MKPTDADIETARLAVSLVLRHEEAAWTPVAELIAQHTRNAVAHEIELANRREAALRATIDTYAEQAIEDGHE